MDALSDLGFMQASIPPLSYDQQLQQCVLELCIFHSAAQRLEDPSRVWETWIQLLCTSKGILTHISYMHVLIIRAMVYTWSQGISASATEAVLFSLA